MAPEQNPHFCFFLFNIQSSSQHLSETNFWTGKHKYVHFNCSLKAFCAIFKYLGDQQENPEQSYLLHQFWICTQKYFHSLFYLLFQKHLSSEYSINKKILFSSTYNLCKVCLCLSKGINMGRIMRHRNICSTTVTLKVHKTKKD